MMEEPDDYNVLDGDSDMFEDEEEDTGFTQIDEEEAADKRFYGEENIR